MKNEEEPPRPLKLEDFPDYLEYPALLPTMISEWGVTHPVLDHTLCYKPYMGMEKCLLFFALDFKRLYMGCPIAHV